MDPPSISPSTRPQVRLVVFGSVFLCNSLAHLSHKIFTKDSYLNFQKIIILWIRIQVLILLVMYDINFILNLFLCLLVQTALSRCQSNMVRDPATVLDTLRTLIQPEINIRQVSAVIHYIDAHLDKKYNCNLQKNN